MEFWNAVTIRDNIYYQARLGPLQIFIVKQGNELKISESRLSGEDLSSENWESEVSPIQPGDALESEGWKRWIVSAENFSLQFSPMMPNRPVIVRPESQIQLLPGGKTRFYVSIPLWLRIMTGDKQVLTEIPTLILSNIWFGDQIAGELCYAIKSQAMTNFEKRKMKVYTAVCPILIENQSEKSFIFQRLSIHTEYLGVFLGTKHLWTNQIEVKLEGEEQKSVIDISENAPGIEKIKEKLSDAREVPSKKFYRKVFSELPFIRG
jgi:hypothetical protein